MMTKRVITLLAGVSAWACGGDSTQPPGPPADLLKSGGDAQSWYFDNPLPTPLSVTAVDLDGRGVPGVVVTWSVASGMGAVSPLQSTTNASGVATTTDSVGFSTIQNVNATFTGLPGPVTFTEHATTPPTTAAVSVNDNVFSPTSSVIKTGGTVTWTWAGANMHKLIFTSGPTPRPANEGNHTNPATAARTITAVGTYNYTCTNHGGMNGKVTVVH